MCKICVWENFTCYSINIKFFFSFHFGCCLLTGEKVFTSVNRLDALFPKEQIALTAFQQTVVCTGTTQNPIIKWPMGQSSKDFSTLTGPLIVAEDLLWLEAHRNIRAFHFPFKFKQLWVFPVLNHWPFSLLNLYQNMVLNDFWHLMLKETKSLILKLSIYDSFNNLMS